MSDDHIKRFKLSEKQPHRPFNAKVRDLRSQDNVQPPPPKPRFVTLDNPFLAPPGAVGVRLSNDARKWMEAKRAEQPPTREFKPLARNGPDKDRGPSR